MAKQERLDPRRCETCFYCEEDECDLCCVCAESEHCAYIVSWWDVCEHWFDREQGIKLRRL